MEERAKKTVPLPHPVPTASYWHVPRARIADHRTTDDLPSTADYVIVGSGISGACIAYNLLEQRPDAKVLMLEARTACGGATGRNGGHTKAATYRAFRQNARKLGEHEASLIARLERANIVETHKFAREHDIDCDSNPCRTVDVFYDQGQWDAGIKAVKYMRNVFGEGESGATGVDSYTIHGPEVTAKRFLCQSAIGSLEYDAGSINGYKFTTGVLELALEKGLNLQTNTRVTTMGPQDAESNGFTNGGVPAHGYVTKVETDRGPVVTKHVILATNGYTAMLLPERFQGIIVPLRGQVTAQRPGSKLPNHGSLPTTYSFIYDVGYEYMIPRPAGKLHAGDIVIGGGWAKLPDEGVSQFGEADDSVCDNKISEYLSSCCADRFFHENWGEDHAEGRIRQEWTGIMGTSADGLPYVGQVPGKDGCWISASFDGHGMVLCLKSAQALVTMLLEGEDSRSLDSWFPKSFRVTEERLRCKFAGRRNVKAPENDPVETNGHAK